MSEFSEPQGKIYFHLGDILSVVSVGAWPPSVHPSPVMNGSVLAARSAGIEGMIQLVEYVTGEEVPVRSPAEGNGKIIDNTRFRALLVQAAAHLLMPKNRGERYVTAAELPTALEQIINHYPLFERLSDEFTRTVPSPERQARFPQWLRAKTDQYGEYFEVLPMQEKDKFLMRKHPPQRGGGGSMDFSA